MNYLIWVPKSERSKVLFDYHDHVLAGHPGQSKTLSLIKQTFCWPGITQDINDYIKKCLTCVRSKPSRMKPQGLLQPLKILDGPWRSVSVDFVVELPPLDGKDAVMVVVDRFLKWQNLSLVQPSQQQLKL